MQLLFPIDKLKDQRSRYAGDICGGMTARKVGLAGECLTEFVLWSLCESVSKAPEGSAYDLLAEHKGHILKIQVKTSRYCSHGHNQKAFRYDFKRQSKVTTSKGRRTFNRRFYDGECDLFALVAFELKRVFFIPGDRGCKVLAFGWQSFDVDDIEKISFESSVRKIIGTSGDL